MFIWARVLSRARLYAIAWTLALQAPLPMGFPRKEYWSRLSFPPPGGLPDPGIELASLEFPALAGGFFTTVSPYCKVFLLSFFKRQCTVLSEWQIFSFVNGLVGSLLEFWH